MKRFFLALFLGTLVLGGVVAQTAAVRWRAVLAAGYAHDGQGAPLANWDTSCRRVHDLLVGRGVDPADILVLTSDPGPLAPTLGGSPLGRATAAALAQGLESLRPGPGEGLLVFLTSHGSRDGGWILEAGGVSGQRYDVTPADLARWLGPPGDEPVAVVISSCFAGQFLDEAALVTPGRVVLTAARRDRSSFGCGPGSAVPEWDDSLLQAWAALPPGASWGGLARTAAEATAAKEAAQSGLRPSLPQTFVGTEVAYGVP